MMGQRFNPQLTRGRVQSSDWPARLSIRIKRLLNIVCSVRHPNFIIYLGSFNNDIIFQNSFTFLINFFWSLEPNTGDIYLI